MSEKSKLERKVRWLPLESNTDTFNKYILQLGVKQTCKFFDIYGFDEELEWIPKPCLAVLFIYPCRGEKVKSHIRELEKKLEENPQKINPLVYFKRQTIKNACGTVGLLHVLTNVLGSLDLEKDSVILDFYEKSKKLSPIEKGRFLETYKPIEEIHEKIAKDGSNQVVIEDGKEDEFKYVDDHFISFVNVENELYLLDGARNQAVLCGKTSEKDFVRDAAREMKVFMKLDPKSYHFSAMAFSKQ